MSRIIKFRVWDKETKTMVFTGFHLLGEVMAFGGIEEHLFKNKLGRTTLERWNDIIPMQFTGLKDKNGIEIYEGDIVKIFIDDEKENFELWEIAFQEASFKIKKNHFDEQTTIASVFFMPLESDESFYSHELYEVIGNIYSNPELLNQK